MANEHVQRCSTSVDIRGGKLQDTTTCLLEFLPSKPVIPRICKDAEHLELLHVAGRILNGTTTLAVSFKVNITT